MTDQPAPAAATPDTVIADLHIPAQSDYGRGWNSALDAALAALRREGLLPPKEQDQSE